MAIWNQTTSEQNSEKPTPAAAPAMPQATVIPVAKEGSARGSRESVFGAGVSIEGKIEGDADVRMAGKFKGEIQIKGDLYIEKGASLAAKVSAANVSLSGELSGNVMATGQVRLMESGQMVGDLKANTFTVAAGSRMRGHVEFGWDSREAAKFDNGQVRENDKNRAGG
ncbi:MAG TPA: polymer-forming cytoskeletal protein [Candidatus Binatia bacterium]|nr:polymer-forming cytoskeletal protein [Candidatus Binatia bacterium]